MPSVTRLILNGKGAANPAVREAVASLRNQGHTLEVRTTWEAGDAARLAREALHDKISRLIAGGGDGTINEVVNGLFSESAAPQIELGFLPLGTANDFVTSCGLPLAPRPALEFALTGSAVAIDVGKANDEFFLNVATGGFGAQVTETTPTNLKRWMGGGAYALVGIITAFKLEPYQGRMLGPDGPEEGAVIVMAVGNGRQAGGGVPLTPKATLDDGLLDVMFVRDFPGSALGEVLAELQDMGNTANQIVYYRQMPHFVIEGNAAAPLNLDGEPHRWKTIRFQCLPRALQAVIPSECPLLSANSR